MLLLKVYREIQDESEAKSARTKYDRMSMHVQAIFWWMCCVRTLEIEEGGKALGSWRRVMRTDVTGLIM